MTVKSGESEVVVDSYARVERIGFGILMIGAPTDAGGGVLSPIRDPRRL